MVALVLADAMVEKLGGDSLPEVRRNLDGYLEAIPSTMKTSAAPQPQP
jgi:chorismate synthase